MTAAVPGAIVLASVALAAALWGVLRRGRAQRRANQFDERELYDRGRAAAAALRARTQATRAVFEGLAPFRRRRRAELDRQLVRVLPQVAANVRSAQTVERALRAAAQHVEDPLRGELSRVLADAAYGVPLPDALARMAQRTGSVDVRALAAALRVQQRFGGPVAPVIDLLAAHARSRERAMRELRTELAGTRLTKWFVAASMPAIFAIMYLSNAEFASFYQREPLGWALLAGAVAAEAIGLAVCRRITSLDVRGV